MTRKIYIIDTFGFLFKLYTGLKEPLFNRNGISTNLISGFVRFLISLKKKKIDFSNVIFALEGENNFRKILSANYKAHRIPATEDFKIQSSKIIELIKKMGFPAPSLYGYEADDIIGTLSRKFYENGDEVYIVSADKDMIQLMNNRIFLCREYDSPEKFITRDEVFDEFGVYPEQFVDFLSLVGDDSDGVKGVGGIGKVTAKNLLQQFNSLDQIYSRIREVSKKGVASKLLEDRENAYLSRQLVSIKQDLDISLPELNLTGKEPLLKILPDLLELEIYSATDYLIKNGLVTAEQIRDYDNFNFKFEVEIIREIDELNKVLDSFNIDDIVSFDTETDGTDIFNSQIVGFSFANERDISRGYYVPIGHSYLGADPQIELKDLKNILYKFNNFKLVGHNYKFDRHIIFSNFNIKLNFYNDTMILAWLLDSDDRSSLDHLSYKYLSHKKIKFSSLVPSGSKGTFADVMIEDGAKYAVEDAIATLRLFFKLKEILPENLYLIGNSLEMEVSNSIFDMERLGIGIDKKYLAEIEIIYKNEVDKIAKDIHKIAGHEFNLNSPKQVAEVIYDELKLESSVRSTDEERLNNLYDQHIIIPEILKYREKFKLLSTYIIPLQKFDIKGRIHSQFNQTGTTTGRFSSQDPNLQNIPVGSSIRTSFVSPEGYSLLSLDYSQIELRFLAHFSEDETLLESFANNRDIHAVVANRLNISRSSAKSVNFGLIYGMGTKKLAQTIGIADEVAKKIVDDYFREFSNIKKYQTIVFEQMRNLGYVETILGHRRRFQKAKNMMEEATNNREAFNTIFQGSSADLIKIAMIEIEKNQKNIDAKLLIQVHDELIYEVKDSHIEIARELFSKIMSEVMKLKVPLIVGSKVGKNWGELV